MKVFSHILKGVGSKAMKFGSHFVKGDWYPVMWYYSHALCSGLLPPPRMGRPT